MTFSFSVLSLLLFSRFEPRLSRLHAKMSFKAIDIPSEAGISSKVSKKQKLAGSVQYNVSTRNSFDALSDQEEETSEPVSKTPSETAQRKVKVPPIVIYSYFDNHLATLTKVKANLKGDLAVKHRGNRMILCTELMEDHQTVMEELKKSNFQFHSYTKPEEKPKSLVVKGIPPNVLTSEITADLTNKGFTVSSVTQITQPAIEDKNLPERKLPVFHVKFAPSTNVSDVYKVKRLCYCVVSWGKFNKPKRITQCYKCQSFGHVSANCYKKPKCVKCAGEHNTKECPQKENPVLRCANCGENHVASHRKCKVYVKLLEGQKQKEAQLPRQHQVFPTPGGQRENTVSRNYSQAVLRQRHQTESEASTVQQQPISGVKDSDSSVNAENLIQVIQSLFVNSDLNKLILTATKFINNFCNAKDVTTKIVCVIEGLKELLYP